MNPPRPRTADQASPRLRRTLDRETEHALKNQLAIILGYCELLLAETPTSDARHEGLSEMERAAKMALNLLREVREP